MKIVYTISAISVLQRRQHAYLHNLFQANNCFVLDLRWVVAESYIKLQYFVTILS